MSARGAVLLEVLVSFVILSMAVLTIFSVAAGGTRNEIEVSDAERADNTISALTAALQNYVTANPSAEAAGSAPSGSWALPGDGCDWALATPDEGCAVHDATASGLLDPSLKDRPGVKLTYTVALLNDSLDAAGAPAPGGRRVDASLCWREPGEPPCP